MKRLSGITPAEYALRRRQLMEAAGDDAILVLPAAPERVHIMLDFKAPWVQVPTGPGEVHFARYPDDSLDDWHKRHGLWID